MGAKCILVSIPTLFAFAIYWMTTLLYVSPNNPLRIEFDRYLTFFEHFGYQQWNFFAPPPVSNEQLYYQFFSEEDSDDIITLDASTPITTAKRQTRPFNTEAEMLDYIILGAAGMLMEEYLVSAQIDRDSIDSSYEFYDARPGQDTLDPSKNNSPPLVTLTRYAKVVARKNNLTNNQLRARIIYCQTPISPLRERGPQNEPMPLREEAAQRIIYITEPFSVGEF
jgi:hypothetical protein